ncbi:MAG: HlyD family type I secretion periplasmic adaptor subunit [Pseudomonadota bacterium]
MKLGKDRIQKTSSEALVIPLDFQLERQEHRFHALALGLIALIVSLIMILASAPMREISNASGTIEPSADIVELRHVEGGAVTDVLAKPGDTVIEGQPIARLRSTDETQEHKRLTARFNHLTARQAMLNALLADQDMLSEEAIADLAASHVAVTQYMLRIERAAIASQVERLLARVAEKRREAVAERDEAEGFAAEVAAFDEQIAMREALVKRGHSPKRGVLELTAERAEAEARRRSSLGRSATALLAADGFEVEIEQVKAQKASEWASLLASTSGEIDEIRPQIARLSARLEQSTVRSTIDGVVQSLGIAAAGDALRPNGVVATIVPEESELVADVRVSPDDIGYISIGEQAVVRVTTFDPEVFGELKGHVAVISPTSFEDEQGERYYLATLELEGVGDTASEYADKLAPGMIVNAEILSGSKSILRYLMKPVTRAFDGAFSEK